MTETPKAPPNGFTIRTKRAIIDVSVHELDGKPLAEALQHLVQKAHDALETTPYAGEGRAMHQIIPFWTPPHSDDVVQPGQPDLTPEFESREVGYFEFSNADPTPGPDDTQPSTPSTSEHDTPSPDLPPGEDTVGRTEPPHDQD